MIISYFIRRYNIPMSFERVQHLVDIDEHIFAAFVIDPAGNISELFIAPDTDLDKSKVRKRSH
jgi:hypothetical protein